MLNKNKQGAASVVPTLYQGKQGAGYTPQRGTNNTNSTTGGNKSGTSNDTTRTMGTEEKQITAEEFKTILPIISPEFTLDYSDPLQKYVVTMKSDEAGNTGVSQQAYAQWQGNNPSYVPLLPQENVIMAQQSVEELNKALDYAEKNKLSSEQQFKKNNDTLLSIINTLFAPIVVPSVSITIPPPSPKPSASPTIPTPGGKKPTPKKSQSTTPSTPPSPPSGTYTYYSQCSGPYDALPLPEGCTICAAGCGPTSVAMILSSYVDKSLTPPKMVDLMSKAGVRIGCYGSYVSEIYSYLSGRGDIKVSSFIIPSGGQLLEKDVAKDFRGYTQSGWTIFVLANFKQDGGGHYFWVTDVNENGDILAYDPYYGKQQTPPISENRYAPAPYYRFAFAIKKI